MSRPSRRRTSEPRRRDRAARRAQLLDAADVVIRESGPEASMTLIASAAGVTKPILYRHFGDKGGLYRALAERYLGPLMDAVQDAMSASADGRDRMRATVDAYLAFIERDPHIYRFLLHRVPAEEPQAGSLVSDAIRALGEQAGDALLASRDVDDEHALAVRALGHGLVGMIHLAGDWWLEQPQLGRAHLVDALTTVLWGGLSTLDAETRPART